MYVCAYVAYEHKYDKSRLFKKTDMQKVIISDKKVL